MATGGIEMEAKEGLPVDPVEQANDGATDAAPLPNSEPIWKRYCQIAAGMNKLPAGWREKPVAAFLAHVGDDAEPALHPDVRRLVSLIEQDEGLVFPAAVCLAESHIEEGNYERALEVLDAVIAGVEADGECPAAIRQNTGAEPLVFRNAFERALHLHLNGADHLSIPAPEGLFGLYHLRGWVSAELGLHEKAARSLETATALNPIDCAPLFELGETCKARGDLDGFLSLTRRAFEVAYTAESLSRCLRNIGYFEIERGNFDLAAASLWRSLALDPASGMAWSELAYLRALTGAPLREPTADEITSTLTVNDIPLGASDAVTTVASTLARESLAAGRHEDALLACHILCDVAPA